MKLIPLTRGLFTQVDDEDFDFLNQWKWTATSLRSNSIYAFRRDYSLGRNNGKSIFMHRLIMSLNDKNKLVDHSDRNGLNNQKSNLRICTRSQNNANKRPVGNSKFLGVYKVTHIDKYINKKQESKEYITIRYTAHIACNRKQYYLGSFKNEIDAALAYNKKASELHGEFANLNTIE